MTAPQQNFKASFATIVEVEFFHIMIDSDVKDEAMRLVPRPDQLHSDLNTPVTGITSNGLLVWLPDGSVVHGDWSTECQEFTRRDGKPNLLLGEVRAWSALPQPVAAA